jgi:hypothetical protein
MVKELAIASGGIFQFLIFKPITSGWEIVDVALGPSKNFKDLTSYNPGAQVFEYLYCIYNNIINNLFIYIVIFLYC